MNAELNKSKLAFINRDLKIMAWNSSVQRAKLYNPHASEKAKKIFRDNVWQIIEQELIPKYNKPVNEKQHQDQICYLKQKTEEITDHHILGNGGYKIGIAQKVFNLYLKYLWCLDEIPEPPHCPIDAIIINQLPTKDLPNWTEINTMDAYKEVIEAIRKQAQKNKQTIVRWELKNYS